MQLKEKPLLLKTVLIICFQVYVLAVVGIEVVFKNATVSEVMFYLGLPVLAGIFYVVENKVANEGNKVLIITKALVFTLFSYAIAVLVGTNFKLFLGGEF